ncbi:MAG: sigma-70 family RNA polymerase sigma factor [Planctomycetaceae bacterium]|nr:sigma-70 family RNA polymerase sigma factor [Planctomycetaceae bacterium]
MDDARNDVNALIAGDDRAWRELVRSFSAPMLLYARTFIPDEHGAQDIVQQAFVRLYRRRRKIDLTRGSLRGLCFKIVRNLALDALRADSTRQRRESEAAAMWTSGQDSGADQELAKLAWEMADKLPAELREPLMLRFACGLSRAEIADVLDIPEGTAATRQRTALEELRSKIALRSPMLGVFGIDRLEQALSVPGSGSAASSGALPAAIHVSTNTVTLMEAAVMAAIGVKTAKWVAAAVIVLLLATGGVSWWWPEADARTETRNTKSIAISGASSGERNERNARVPIQDVTTTPEPVRNEKTVGDAPDNTSEVADADLSGVVIEISGVVTDDQGAPLAGIPVKLSRDFMNGVNLGVPHQLAKVITDKGGKYCSRFNLADYQLDFDRVRIWLMATAFVSEHHYGINSIHLDYVPGQKAYQANMAIKILAPFKAICYVRDQSGFPVPNARCSWVSRRDPFYYADGSAVEAMTDDEGIAELTLPVVLQGSSRLQLCGDRLIAVEADGYGIGNSDAIHVDNPSAETLIERTVVLTPGGDISGQFVDDQGLPISNATFKVGLMPEFAWKKWHGGHGLIHPASMRQELATDGGGYFRIPNVPFVTYALQFDLTTESLRHDHQVRAKAGDTHVIVHFRPDQLCNVELSYRIEGSEEFLNVCGMQYEVLSGNEKGASGGGTVCNPITYVGEIRLTAYFMGYATPFIHEVKTVRGETGTRIFDVRFPHDLQRMSGIVLSEQGQAIEGASVDLIMSGRRQGLATSMDDGTFEILAVPPGEYTLQVIRSGYAASPITFSVPDTSSRIEPVIVRMSQSCGLLVTLPFGSSSGDWSFHLRIRSSDGEEACIGNLRGNQYRESFPPGKTIIYIETTAFHTVPFEEDLYSRTIELDSGKDAVCEITNVPMVTASGFIVDAAGTPCASKEIDYLYRIGQTGRPDELVQKVGRYSSKTRHRTDNNGKFTIPGLIPGRYALWIGGDLVEFTIDETSAKNSILLTLSKK